MEVFNKALPEFSEHLSSIKINAGKLFKV